MRWEGALTRTVRWVFVSTLLSSLFLFASTPAVASMTATENRLHSLVNDERQSVALSGLRLNDRLSEIAQRHSRDMAERARLFHGDLKRLVSRYDYDVVGENVGVGDGVDILVSEFLSSPVHRANIVDGRWKKTGIGIVRRDGELWVTQLFAA